MTNPDDFDELAGFDARDEEGEGSALFPPFLLDPIGIARRRWPWMVLALVIGAVATAAVLMTLEPTYEAKASILITSQQIPEDFVRSTVREDAISNVNAMIGEVLSRDKLTRLIEKHHLFADAEPDTPLNTLVDRMRSRITAAPSDEYSVRRYPSSLIYEIGYESKKPEEAAAVANSLASLFVEASIQRRTNQARRTTAFLKSALASDEAELREQSRRVSDFRREHRGELPDELNTNLRKLDLATQRRESVANQIADKEKRIETLSKEPGAYEKSENQDLLAELRRSLARELASNTEAHPNVQALRRRIARLEEAVAAEKQRPIAASSQLGREIDSERFELRRLQDELRELDVQIKDLNGRIDRTPAISDQLDALADTESVLREKYLASLRKVEDAELAERLESAQQGAQISTLDQAEVPGSPKHPTWMFAAGGAGGTLALALGLALLLELFDPVVLTTRQLESLADRPALGALPRIA